MTDPIEDLAAILRGETPPSEAPPAEPPGPRAPAPNLYQGSGGGNAIPPDPDTAFASALHQRTVEIVNRTRIPEGWTQLYPFDH